MRSYIIRKTLSSLFVLVCIIIIIFMINVSMPAKITNSQDFFSMPKAQKDAIRKKLLLDEPKSVQLKFWVKGLFNGSLGYSYASGRPVTVIVKKPLINTLKLVYGSFFISLLIALPIGVICATRQNRKTDLILSSLSLIGICLPSFFFASLAASIFLYNTTVFTFFTKHGHLDFKQYQMMMSGKILPFAILTVINLATLSRYARSSMIDVVKQEYIKTAQAKGLKDFKVYYKHGLKNALILMLTVIGLVMPSLLTSTYFVEVVLGYPGIARLFIGAVFRRDYGLSMGLSIIISAFIVFSNYVVDICYILIDPRIKYTRTQ
jgi:peptide/nickel transport system permease protein